MIVEGDDLAGGEGALGFLEVDARAEGEPVLVKGEGSVGDGGGGVAVAGLGEEGGGLPEDLAGEAQVEDFDRRLVEALGVGLIECDVKGVFPVIFIDDDICLVVGVAGHPDTLALAEGIMVKAAMGADGFAPMVDDGAGLIGDVFGEEFIDIDLAEKADALAVFLGGVGESVLVRDFPDLGFGKFAYGEEGSGDLPLMQEGEEVALVFVGVAAFEEGGGAVGEVASPAIVTGGDTVETVTQGPLEEDAEFHFPVAEHIGVGGNAAAVTVDEVVDDGLPVFADEVDDLEGDAELITDGAPVLDILLGGAAAEDIGLIHPDLDVGGGDIISLFFQEEGGDGAVDSAGHGDQYLLHSGIQSSCCQ